VADFVNMDHQERIIEKAHELFLRYGIRSISMDEIAHHLGMSKKTIYQFFTDKDALVEAVVDMELNSNENECLICTQRSENPVHEIYLGMEMMDDMLRLTNPALIYDMQKYHPSSYRKLENHQQGFLFGLIRENLLRGVEQGLYRPEINVNILAKYRLLSVFMVFNPEAFPAGKSDLGAIVCELTLNFLYGICTPKGQKLIQKYNQARNKNHNHDERK
jgi:AcrR family transcriptional regulator